MRLSGKGGGKNWLSDCVEPFLGKFPSDRGVSDGGDPGGPMVRKHPDWPVAAAYLALATAVLKRFKEMPAPDQLPEVQL